MYNIIFLIICFFLNQLQSFASDSIDFVTKPTILKDERIILISKEQIFDANDKITIDDSRFRHNFKWDNKAPLNAKNKYHVNNKYDVGFFHKSSTVDSKICDPQTNICNCPLGSLFIENTDKKTLNQNVESPLVFQIELPLDLRNYKIVKNNYRQIKFYDDDNIVCDGYEIKTQNIFLYTDSNAQFVSISNKAKEWQLIKGVKNQNPQEESFLIAQFVEKINASYNFLDPKNICANAQKTYDKEKDMTIIDCTLK
jgi:hypothetical protein